MESWLIAVSPGLTTLWGLASSEVTKEGESPPFFQLRGLEPFDVAIGLQGGKQNVQEPQAHKEQSCGKSAPFGAPQFPSKVRPPPVQQDADADESEDGEQRHREGEGACWHVELLSLVSPVDGGHWPRQSNAQEDVDGIAARDIANGSICIHVLDGGCFASKSVWKGEVKRGHEEQRKTAGGGSVMLT